MANPQLENGYTPIANEILEAMFKMRLSSLDWVILLCIMRNSYGWNRKTAPLTLTQISKYTNIDVRNIPRFIKRLINCNIIVKNEVGFALQKDYERWILHTGVCHTGVCHTGIRRKFIQAYELSSYRRMNTAPLKPSTVAASQLPKERLKERKKESLSLINKEEPFQDEKQEAREREDLIKKEWKEKLPDRHIPDVDFNRIDYFLYLFGRKEVAVDKLKSLRAFIKSLNPNGFPNILEREKEKMEKGKKHTEAVRRKEEIEKSEAMKHGYKKEKWNKLPAERQEQICEQARKKLPAFLRTSDKAVLSKAHELMEAEGTL